MDREGGDSSQKSPRVEPIFCPYLVFRVSFLAESPTDFLWHAGLGVPRAVKGDLRKRPE